jgi:hypothetical protein
MISLNKLRDQVRSMADLDEADLPNSVIDQFAREGFERIYMLERRWPYLQKSFTLTTVAGTRSYTIENIGDIREIISVVDTSTSGSRMNLISYDDAEEIWLGNTDVPSRPYFFSIWEDKIHFWPKPDNAYPIKVRVYRNPSYDWLDSPDDDIDLDEWFHALLPYFVLSRVYQRQEDAELSAMYLRSFEEGVGLARRDLMKASSARPAIMSGGKEYPTMRRWLQTLGATLGQ